MGFLTRGVVDTAVLFDAVSEGTGYAAAAAAGPDRTLKIAVSRKPAMPVRLAASCAEALERTAQRIKGLGHLVSEAEPAYGQLSPAFVPRYLRSARDSAVRLVDPQLLAPAARVPAWLGRWVSLEQVARSRRRGERWAAAVTEQIFADADVLLTPAQPTPAERADRFRPRQPLRSALRASARTAYSAPWNVAGFPAASVPAGFSPEGLPLAVQLVALPGAERLLIALAAQLQRADDWTLRRPA
jgi:amidase